MCVTPQEMREFLVRVANLCYRTEIPLYRLQRGLQLTCANGLSA